MLNKISHREHKDFLKLILLIIYIILFLHTDIFADAVHLKNGSKITGIIMKETEESVEIEINIGATVTFLKQDIEKIDRGVDREHSKMKEEWQLEKAERETKVVRDESFEREQREKGLVEYKGKWVRVEEKERLLTASVANEEHAERRFSYKKDDEKRSDFADKILDNRGDWFVKETENFSVFYKDLSHGKIVSDKAEYYFEKITYDLGYEKEISWKKKCQVYIVKGVDEWKEFLKSIGFVPDLVGGFVPNYGEKEMFLCALSDTYLAVTFPHELTHLIFKEIAGNSTIPLWLNEGLANYEASVMSISNELLIENIRRGQHILLGDLLRMSNYPEGKDMRELFYAQSEKMVEFLITQYGREKFRKFCELILKDKAFKDSVLTAYKGDFEDLEDFNIKLVEYIVK